MLYITPQGDHTETTLPELLATSQYTLLYFYPKDNTPGCTIEARDFTRLMGEFSMAGVQIIGVSKDSAKSHCSFQNKHELSIGLIADTDTTLAQQFGARGEKKFMGKAYMGVSRNTYLLDKEGNIVYKREQVSANGHAEEVLAYVQANITQE